MLSKSEVDKLYTEYSPALFTYLYRFTGSRELAQDLLHDIYLQLIIYSSKKAIQLDTVRAFLYKTGRNLAINTFKRQKGRNYQIIEEQQDIHNHTEQIENQQLIDHIYHLLDNLDAKSRSIFIMKKELDLSLAEIAAHHQVSERTVRRNLEKTISYLLQNTATEDIINFSIFLSELL